MFAVATSFIALALAAGQRAPADDWVVASGTETCSVTSVDFPDGPRGFAAGSFNCGLLTEDGGYSWSPIRVVPDQGQSLMWAHAVSADELYAARRGFYRSTDRGQTWSQVGAWDRESQGTVFDVSFFDASHYVAIKGGQIWSSTDAGVNWTLSFAGDIDMNFHELHFPSAEIGYATGGKLVGGDTLAGTVLRSADAGANWTRLDFPYGKINAASFVDVDHGMVSTQSADGFGLYVTADGAQTWQPLPNPPPGLINQLKHRDAQHWYATTFEGCVYTSRDAGQNWQEGYCDPQQRALASISLRGGAAVAGGNDGLVLYENGVFHDGFDQP